MKQTLDVLNRMEADGIISRYAIGGAVAAYNYVAPAVTEDPDILISFDNAPGQIRSGLITLGPILAYLESKGYTEFRKEGLMIGGWPVQFLPVADDLDGEALERADDVEVDIPGQGAARTRVLRPEYIVAIALRVDRAKDRLRIVQFLDEQAVDLEALRDVLERHGLSAAWSAFCARTGIADPRPVQSKP